MFETIALSRHTVREEFVADLESFHEFSRGHAVYQFGTLPKGETLPPRFMLGFKRGEVHVLPARFDDEEVKAEFLGLVRYLLRAVQPDFYSMASETWVAQVGPDTPPVLAALQPRLREDRRDGLMVATIGRDPRAIRSSQFVVESDDQTGDRTLVPMTDEEDHKGFSGRMVSLYD